MNTTSVQASAPAEQDTAVGEGRRSVDAFLRGCPPILVVTLLLFAVSGVVAPKTLSSTSLLSMLPFAAVLAIAAAGETLVIQQRGLDLSVAGSISLSAILVGVLSSRSGAPLAVALLVVAGVAVAVGLLNGFLVARLAITPLITTLAVNALLIGALQSYSGGSPAVAPTALTGFTSAKPLGVSSLVWVAVVVVALLALVTDRTVLGRRFVAVGAGPATARAGGVAVSRYLIGGYVAGALCFALAGVLLAGYLKTTATTVGDSYLLPVIASVIIGGTPLTGGRGSVVASAIAALFLSQLVQLVLTLGAPSSVQLLIQSAAIALAAILRGLGERGVRGLIPSRAAMDGKTNER